ncbi:MULTISPECIES: DUF4129 domain-containing protein [Mycobacterium]|uniref:Protein-glutamine gamma-glutamyltransferase-like C-terminal domain-containing protein n=1 Tax=Mycobacterium kiyosense TaxID=2871094 RepID=A0A9P3UZN6_9MYCO|nr:MULTISPECIES: DUF4129 domain-containing protein [Mycobacterium]BDB41050.1 hypothetical protein IWGMT90018_14960 [Mycobacterium kiyosense]BDE12846.1 hypothetical protein MKCMC460_17060 [Mycobacterium sp. 20KCMC460]GLB84275.1 hypothetical protein SRL2020028_35310 [Mycobacterium kiyosense]GLB90275.1 hypothetical protein SRL2020130_30920 [Mycobacterium kiyosense]GLB97682.1 hypothetical protein SRL2020226_44580 [Mycobacterium kiyosense]
MGRVDKPTARVIAVIALLILVAAALRGYLPAHHGSRLRESGGSPAALMILAAALAATLALLAFSIIVRLRDPRAVASSAGALPEMLGGGAGRPSWRVIVIAVGVVVAWLVIALLLSRSFTPPDIALDAPQPDTNATPPGAGNAQPPRPPAPRQNTGDILGVLLVTAPLLLMMFVGGIFAARRRTPVATTPPAPDRDIPQSPEAAAESLARAAEVGLAEMADLSRDPRAAIIACYAAMERELANVPGAAPQDFDTPTEVLARAVKHQALQADNAIQLVSLFEEARFSPHVMGEEHRETAVHVLELVLAEIAPRSAMR